MNKENYSLAHIGISVTEKEPQGDAPSEEELALFIEGKLSFDRRQEVISHLNVNPLLYQQWVQLVEFASLASESQHALLSEKAAMTSKRSIFDRLKDWLGWKEYALAGSLAAVVMTVLLWPANHDVGLSPKMDVAPPTATQGRLTDQNRAFAAGLKSVNNSVSQSLNLVSARMSDDVALEKSIYTIYFDWGQITAKGVELCRNGISDEGKKDLRTSLQGINGRLLENKQEPVKGLEGNSDVCLILDQLLIPYY